MTAPLAFPIISSSLHAPLGLGLRGEQERERRYKSSEAQFETRLCFKSTVWTITTANLKITFV